jgi:hypothetical protein
MGSSVQILSSKNINRIKWDNCVKNSEHGVIYALSIYLDNMADNWSGIVMGDYEAVMPVPWRKKWGVRYTYDVPFIQQLGWFCQNNNCNVKQLLRRLFKFVRYGSYSFNFCNKLNYNNLISNNNFIIHLSAPYNNIYSHYKTDALNNLKKASRYNLTIQPCHIELAIKMYENEYRARLLNTTEKDYQNFTALCNALEKQQMVFARQVFDEAANQILGTGLFLRDSRRIYNLMNTTTEQGKLKSANHVLIDNVLKEFAGTGLIFDFEGSDIPGIKQFYEKFGAINQPYPRLQKFNLLPFPASLLKR